MTIETRHSRRINLQFDALLLYRGRCFKVSAKNLSVEGIFLQTGTFSIPTGTLIDMEFTLACHTWQISGLVVHQGVEGVGVMFRVSQPELFLLTNGFAQMPARTAVNRNHSLELLEDR